MRLQTATALAGIILLLTASQASAGLISMTMTPATDINTLLGGSATPVGGLMATPMNSANGQLQSQVLSEAFSFGNKYLYLYQVQNTGAVGNNYIETFTISPMLGATANTQLGYLTTTVPTGFTLGEQLASGVSLDPDSGPTLSFAYPGFLGTAIAPGKTSKSLYVLIDKPVGTAVGNVIDGTIASGNVVAPVPEPSTFVLLTMGAVGLLAYAWRRRTGA
jgi:hypothetical protein